MSTQTDDKQEIYTYTAPHLLYGLGWSYREDRGKRFAVGSFQEETSNSLQIVKFDPGVEHFVAEERHRVELTYPPTRLQFIPDPQANKPDLLACSSDCLRIWRIDEQTGLQQEKVLTAASQGNEFRAPLTSFDWCPVTQNKICTSSLDCTATVWDVEQGTADVKLIAHDKPIYDISWGGEGVFATVSEDRSVRIFDLRDKEHSTIIYEHTKDPENALVRIAWNKMDMRLLATVVQNSNNVLILDIRFPSYPVVELSRHEGAVNTVCWAPYSAQHICTAGDDSQALIWDLSQVGKQQSGQGQGSNVDPILAYKAGAEINQLQLSVKSPEFVAICFGNKAQVLRVDRGMISRGFQ